MKWKEEALQGSKLLYTYLDDGDVVSISLCDDRSASITYNNIEVTQALTDLPDKPLWVVIEMWVGKLEVICP